MKERRTVSLAKPKLAETGQRLQKARRGGIILCIVGAGLMVSGGVAHHWSAEMLKVGLGGIICLGLGLLKLYESFRLPKKEVMQLARDNNGLLTLSEITIALDIEPDLSHRTLRALSKSGIAAQRWQEIRQNVWEFPDYIKLPIAETLDLAKNKGGRVSLKDLLAQGHSLDVAQQTLDALSGKGLAQQDPASTSPALILEAQ